MASYEFGKIQMVVTAKQGFQKGSTCLDVGACEGLWYWLLGDYFKMDGVEVFEPYIEQYHLDDLYEHLFHVDIRDFRYKHYDLIIFGDILEHLTVEDAQRVLEYAYDRCNDFIVALPFKYEQDAINDNEHEIHIQDDLTPELVQERYPMLEPILIYDFYGYYHKKKQ